MDDKRNWIGALLSRRQVVPRWHSPQSALHAGERDSSRSSLRPNSLPKRWLTSLGEQAGRDGADAHLKVELAEMRFLVGNTSESAGLTPENPSLRRAANLWRRATEHDKTQAPPRPDVSAGDRIEQERQNVRLLKSALANYPAQPFMWSELARAYIVLNEDDKAQRAMSCAVQLAGRSAYVRRSAARMYLHLDDPSSALKVVREHPNFRADPRMLSAEIAISSTTGRPSRGAKQGLTILGDANFRPVFLSELAAALGTVEMESGKRNSSRLLFAQSLREPSENTLAQIQWATERDSEIVIPASAWQTQRPFEAQALAARQAGDWDAVLAAAERWLDEELFATRPAMVGSFACFTLEQNQRAEKLASQALLANPHVAPLHNNRAVTRAYLGDLRGAMDDVRNAVGCSALNHPYLVATLGLIGYRSGDHELGAIGYSTALAHFVKRKQVSSAVLASLFWLRELARIGDPTVGGSLEYIKKNLPRFGNAKPEPEIAAMLKFVECEVAQTSLPIPTQTEGQDSTLRELYSRFEIPREVVGLRDRFFEQMSTKI